MLAFWNEISTSDYIHYYDLGVNKLKQNSGRERGLENYQSSMTVERSIVLCEYSTILISFYPQFICILLKWIQLLSFKSQLSKHILRCWMLIAYVYEQHSQNSWEENFTNPIRIWYLIREINESYKYSIHWTLFHRIFAVSLCAQMLNKLNYWKWFNIIVN